MTQTLELLLQKVNKFSLRYKQYKIVKQTIKELQLMSDRDLYDIGISRHDIPMIAKRTMFPY